VGGISRIPATVDMLEKLAEVLEADPAEFFRRET
jgi:hypothetical protein